MRVVTMLPVEVLSPLSVCWEESPFYRKKSNFLKHSIQEIKNCKLFTASRYLFLPLPICRELKNKKQINNHKVQKMLELYLALYTSAFKKVGSNHKPESH